MNSKLRQLQLIQLEILKVIDNICKKYDIQYSLYAGTLLGAVRHKAFIPWDDDLDICMSRNNYNRFIEVWSLEDPEGYAIQNKENTPSFTQSFTKIRKNNTTFLQNEYERGKYNTGIFVDIFPIDRIPSGKLKRYIFYWDCMRYQLYTREFVPPKGNPVVRLVSKILLMFHQSSKRKKLRSKLLLRITRNNNNSELNTVAIETLSTIKTPIPADLLDNYTMLKFEDEEFMCFEKWDEYLKIKFVDYMRLPPESEREWRHHPIILDFEHSYEEFETS